ncbi:unnamed protein product [Sympodiomycopsis kandeliae]
MNSAFTPYRTSWKQTWRQRNGKLSPNSWNFSTYIINLFKAYPLPDNGDTVSVTAEAIKRHPKIPKLKRRDANLWTFPRAVAPVILHWLYWQLTGDVGHPMMAFLYYVVCFKATGISTIRLWHQLGQEYGYLDGEKKRDGVPDDSAVKIFVSLLNTSIGRSLMLILLSYDRALAPTLGWNLILQVGMYPIILDFWFYIYHRSMHESNFLWKFHRTHHLTKHPNTILTLFADAEQELFDIIVMPVLTYLTMSQIPLLQMNFYEWWVCSMYQATIEIGGHSGVRIFVGPFIAGLGLLEPIGMGLIIEDHDLHHRKGYKTSGNYGKQTRVWDRLFGTIIPREECIEGQVDFNEHVKMPW